MNFCQKEDRMFSKKKAVLMECQQMVSYDYYNLGQISEDNDYDCDWKEQVDQKAYSLLEDGFFQIILWALVTCVKLTNYFMWRLKANVGECAVIVFSKK